jgi:hypothetical protein
MQIEEVKGFLHKSYEDVRLARYAAEQQMNFLKKKEHELDLLKDLFKNMLDEREQLQGGSITEEERKLLGESASD